MKPFERGLGPALFGLSILLAIGAAGWGDLYNETDGQYGGAAKVIAEGGSWLIPENNGVPRLVKPPLLYWQMAVAMEIFGINEFAARLPGSIASVLWVFITFLIGRKMGGPWRGFMSGSILLTSLGLFTLGRIVMPEPTFAAFIAAALYCVMAGLDNPSLRRNWFLGFWLCTALASFTKGMHGLLYPLSIVGLAALLCPDSRRNLRSLLSWSGLGIFVLINIPWYLYIESKFPGWISNLLWAEQLGHVAGNSAPATTHGTVPRWQFVALHLAWFFPWSIVALLNLWTRFTNRDRPSNGRSALRPAISFESAMLLSWALVIFASVLLVGQRQDYYAMAMWPAFALGTATLIENRSLRLPAILLAILLASGFFIALALPQIAPSGGTASVAERDTAWTTVTNFDQSVWQSLRLTALVALGSAVICCLLAVFVRGKRQVVALLSAGVCLNLGAVSGTSLVSPYFSLARAAPAIQEAFEPGTTLVYDGGIDTGSSLLFYTSLPLTLLNQDADKDFFVRKFGLGRQRFLDTKQLSPLWKSGAPVIFITEAAKLPEWEALFGGKLVPLARCGTQVVLKN